MQTTELIDGLAMGLRPVPARAAAQRMVAGLAAGAAVSLVAVMLILGTDLSQAVRTSAFWIKWAYGFSMLALASWACLRSARPGRAVGVVALTLLLPVALMGALAVASLGAAPPSQRAGLWLGHTALVCPFLIGVLAVPLFLALLWAFRRFAPTSPRLAGLSSGALAGAAAAVLYSLHCPENAIAFIGSWYTLGMALPALAGTLLGPRLFRW